MSHGRRSTIDHLLESMGRVHPLTDDNFIAGNATMGLEILEDEPKTVAVIASIGGGGLITGVGLRDQSVWNRTSRFAVSNQKQRRQPRYRSRKDRHRNSRIGNRRSWMARVGGACSRACGNG